MPVNVNSCLRLQTLYYLCRTVSKFSRSLLGQKNLPRSPKNPFLPPLNIPDYLKQMSTPIWQLWDNLRKAHGWLIHRKWFKIWQLRHPGPYFFGGCSEQLENSLQLVVDITTRKQGSSRICKLCKNAACTKEFFFNKCSCIISGAIYEYANYRSSMLFKESTELSLFEHVSFT